MPNWNDVLQEISQTPPTDLGGPLDIVRRKYLSRLSDVTGRNSIAYYSGFLSKPGILGTEINDEDKNGFMLCIHEMDRSKGLDLILHTPGGNIAATHSLVSYLKQMFGNDIRAIVPQIAMSAGTMIACSCKSILMGKHSNIGPVDPQLDGLPAIAVKLQFQTAYEEIIEDPRAAVVWEPILRQLGPSFLKECDWAIDWSASFVERELAQNMFLGDPDAAERSKAITNRLAGETNKGHDRHIHIDDCEDIGLKIERLENDPHLQDAVLTVHHCYMHTLSNSVATKIVENHMGRAFMKLMRAEF